MLTFFVKIASLQHGYNSNKAQNEWAYIFSPRDSLFPYHFNLSDSRRHLQIRFFYTWNRKPLFIRGWRQATLQHQPLAPVPYLTISVTLQSLSPCLTSTLSALILVAPVKGFSAQIQSNLRHLTADCSSSQTLQIHASVQLNKCSQV